MPGLWASEARTCLIFAPGWHNQEIEQQASRLMFFDPDVFDYLHLHPDDMIHRGNGSPWWAAT